MNKNKRPKLTTSTASTANLLCDYVNDYGGEDVLQTNGKFIKCKICNSDLGSNKIPPKRFQIKQHVETEMHLKNLQLKKSKQPMIEFKTNEENNFNMDLCDTFVSCDIPLFKVNHVKMKNFFKKHFQINLPDESTLRKNYLTKIYDRSISEIKSKLINHKIWVSIDETTDSTGRNIANVIVGPLNKEPSDCYLLTCNILERTNHTTISQLFFNSMMFLYDNKIQYENVLLFITDAAKYMVKAGQAIQVSYPKMIHLTCLAHGLNRVAEEIRSNYPKVNKLISSVKKIYSKSPLRIEVFKQRAPETPLPPQPVVTRWGTWVEAAIYYSENFNLIKDLIEEMDENEAIAIKEAKKNFESNELRANLAFISSNYSDLVKTIKKLEERNLKIEDSVNLVETQFNFIKNLNQKCVFAKFEYVLSKNSGYKQIKLINDILKGDQNAINDLKFDYSPKEIAAFLFAPITSVDVERSFSAFKSLFTHKRQNFTFENLKKTLIIKFNEKNLQ